MRARYMKPFLVLTLTLLLAAGQAGAWSVFNHGKGIEGSGKMETRELDLKDFQKIDVGGAFDLHVTIGDRQKVAVTIDDNLWGNLVAEVQGNELVLDWDKSCQPDRDCKVEIVVTSLREVSIHGACDAEIEGFRGDSFCYNLSGAGDLTMDGEVDDLEIKVSGAGNADTSDLKAQNVEVSVSGAGNARVYAARSLQARVSGVGKITYYGDPQEKSTRVSGIGSIKRK
jgi:hypothetical protein